MAAAASTGRPRVNIEFYWVCLGKKHFDWSWIEENYPNSHVITVFRDPGARAFSHFNYMKGQKWTIGKPMRNQKIGELFEGQARNEKTN